MAQKKKMHQAVDTHYICPQDDFIVDFHVLMGFVGNKISILSI